MKNCPFCKNAITENNDTCPHCHRVLVERIGNPYKHQSQAVHQETKSSTSKHSKLNFDRLTNLNCNNFKKYIPILALVLIIFL
jgi:hypothetical protein